MADVRTSSPQIQARDEKEALRTSRANAAAAASGEEGADQAEQGALRAWSLVHDLAMLILDSQLLADDQLIETLVRE